MPTPPIRTSRTETLKYIAVRDIAEGEEVTINYNGDPKDQTPVEFKVVK